MPQDVFSRQVNFGGSFSADGARVTFGNFNAGLLVQQIQWQYQQNITRIYEVGSDDIYLVAGRTQGQTTVQRILGPRALALEFYTQFGDVCNAQQNHIQFSLQAGCAGGDGARQRISMRHCVIQQMGGAVAAQDMIINETINLMFLWLTVA